jgi:hypothetical protein
MGSSQRACCLLGYFQGNNNPVICVISDLFWRGIALPCRASVLVLARVALPRRLAWTVRPLLLLLLPVVKLKE